jgi:hypothetical protein
MMENPYTVIVRLPLLVVGPGRHAEENNTVKRVKNAIPNRTINEPPVKYKRRL